MSDNFIHIIFNDKQAVAVDPGMALPVIDFITSANLTLSHILITHHHSDHTNGCLELKKATNCLIACPNDPRLTCLDQCVDENTPLSALSTVISILRTPGHTSSHICFYLKDHNAVFTGDTLFLGGCGRLFEGNPAEMWNSLVKLRNLPPETRVFPGHDYTRDNLEFCRSVMPDSIAIIKRLTAFDNNPSPPSATLSEEKETNVFLMCDSPAFMSSTGITGDPESVFRELRSRKDHW